MPQIEFTKAHGTGNDVIVIADPDGDRDLTAEQVATLCDRRYGIGADGLVRLVRCGAIDEGARILADDPAVEWFMDYRDSSGEKPAMNGNAVRVAARFLIESGLATHTAGSTLPIGTRAGIVDLTRSAAGFQVDLGRWRLANTEPLVRARGLAVARPGMRLTLGTPHVVIALATVAELDSLDLSVIPHVDAAAATDETVCFVVPADPMIVDGTGHVSMRVFEAGVGETLSSGTGVAAAALAVRHWAGAAAPHQWRVQTRGGTIGVRMFATEEGEHVGISAPAALVYSGTITLAE